MEPKSFSLLKDFLKTNDTNGPYGWRKRTISSTSSPSQGLSSFSRGSRPRRGENITNRDSKSLSSFKLPIKERERGQSVRSEKTNVRYVISTSKGKPTNDDADSDNSYKTTYIGYKYLNELRKKEPQVVLCEVLKINTPFDAFLNEPDLEADWLYLIVKIISRLCVLDFVGNRCELLNRICKSTILRTISNHLFDIAIETNEHTVDKLKFFIEDLVEFMASVIHTLPSLACEIDLKKIMKKTLLAIDNINSENSANVEESCVSRLKNLVDRIDDYQAVLEKRSSSNKMEVKKYEGAPPEDFRELSLYPTYEDLTRNSFGFVRENKIKGAYYNAEHYLDVQFRLLREDFIDPLRTGLQEYLKASSQNVTKIKSKYESIRLYGCTKFMSLYVTKTNKVGFVLNFDLNSRMTKFKWEYSKRLMFGSLLLFSEDNFNTFICGTVLDRDITELQKGLVLVSLPDLQIDESFFKKEFIMAESEVFFEPYFLVLNALTSLEEINFPMPKYIVYGEYQTSIPAYVSRFENWDILGFELTPDQVESWPSSAELHLDDSQREAFKTALTSDFSVIQGPPGTGKTYIGLKIMEVLLTNMRMNRKVLNTPILIVCYTNHALDQFLEGILEHTNKIVRAGSQSKSEVLKRYNLRGEQQNFLRRQARYMYSNIAESKYTVEKCIGDIEYWNKMKTNIEMPEGIVSYEHISKVMTESEKHYFRSDKDLWRWLLPIKNHEIPDEYFNDDDDSWMRFLHLSDIKPSENTINTSIEELVEDDYSEYKYLDESFETPKMKIGTPCYYKTLKDLGDTCDSFIIKYTHLKHEIFNLTGRDYMARLNLQYQLKESIRIQQVEYQMLRENLVNPQYDSDFHLTISDSMNIRKLDLSLRWKVYWNWISKLHKLVLSLLNKAQDNCRLKSAQHEEYKQMEDLFVVQHSEVIGMTTTCAARFHPLLRTVKPKIVIIEEAAEVLESHIVVSLTNQCEHVILIGDHKQLKPSAAVHKLCKKYNFDVSLFERMINNGMYCPTLNIQHRMRPEISRLITPLIYPELHDHESVNDYEPIRGLKKNLFFFNHNHFEQEVDDTMSRKNLFEADFALQLCKYLLLQGYSENSITILTTYAGQMFTIRDKKKNNPLLQRVRCIVVDKYQGEENDIIILSLVRSNQDAKIGFLRTENRLCVALSRAKKGLYIVGNMDNLCQSSPLWVKLNELFEEQNAIGRELLLYCKKHDHETLIKTIEDFDEVQEGGCNNLCGELLKCGHNCLSLCHPLDREHEEIKCREKCSKVCLRFHPCLQLCYETCNRCNVREERLLKCGHMKILPCFQDEFQFLCDVVLDDISPHCSHPIKRQCHQKPEDAPCSVLCEARLDCGHSCTKKCHVQNDPDHIEFKCHKLCEKLNESCSAEHKCQKLCFEDCGLCTVPIVKKLPCDHERKLSCWINVTQIECYRSCEKSCIDCGVRCKKKCHEPCQPCQNIVMKKIEECGHTVKIKCGITPERSMCVKKCESVKDCGHECRLRCGEPCYYKECREVVKATGIQGLCGHNFVKVLCYQKDEVESIDKNKVVQFCDEPCGELLKCGDLCGGTCGQCWQKRLHKSCEQKCGRTLICGHSCNYPCREICPPCEELCMTKCKHSTCKKRCGIPCVQCQEKCNWGCKHSRCSRKCFQICNRDPCYEPCQKVLECGHPCVGFCGDPCPPVCKVCNPEITEIFLGYEDEKEARFVLLEDCSHSVESQGLEIFLGTSQSSGEIILKRCPVCSTPITKTMRFLNYVKKTQERIVQVKKKVFGLGLHERKELSYQFKRLDDKYKFLLHQFGLWTLEKTIMDFQRFLSVAKNGRNITAVSSFELSAAQYFYNLFSTIVSLLTRLSDQEQSKSTSTRSSRGRTVTDLSSTARTSLEYLREIIEKAVRSKRKVNQQQCEDITIEVNRFGKIIDFCKIMNDPMYMSVDMTKKEEIKEMTNEIERVLFGKSRFGEDKEKLVDQLFKDFLEKIKSSQQVGLTAEEKKSINLAMSRSFTSGGQGHWFTCSKGHIYCITECGGAMEVGKCPECGEEIGGSNHRYLPTTKLATDMDGATRPAWSGINEMGNYIF